MFDMFGTAFFTALLEAAEARLDLADPCLAVFRAACAANTLETTIAVQDALGRLDQDLAHQLMADAHKILRGRPLPGSSPVDPAPTRH